jgi:CheY-like chemotaxis protein
VRNCLATMASTGRTAQHEVSTDLEPAWIDADPTRFEQIVANLLDNAVKYTPAGGSIAVTVRVYGDEVVLGVSDSGVGISSELMPYVFELFVQGHRALDRAQGGLGVGLALVRRLAEMHGGRVAAFSAGVGQGSGFEVRVARAAEPEALPDMRTAPPSSGHKVLLIEDNQDAREMLAVMLDAQDYRVTSAEDGYEGLRLAAETGPDVALIDIGLPGIDGYEVARRLRADPGTSKVRLIALTGYGQDADQQRALDAGFDAHLVKPVDMDHLLEVLENP